MELVVLHVPNRLLALRIDPGSNTVVFALLPAIWLYISDLGNAPNADCTLDACGEKQVFVFSLTRGISDASDAQERPSVAA